MMEQDQLTDTSSTYCATEFPTAKKESERLITTDLTKQALLSPVFNETTLLPQGTSEPGIIKQAKEEILEQLEAALGQFAELQKQMWESQREHEKLFQSDAFELAKAQQELEAERTSLDKHMLLSAELEEQKRQTDQEDNKQKQELEALQAESARLDGDIHQKETDLAVTQYEIKLLHQKGKEQAGLFDDLLREEAKIANEVETKRSECRQEEIDAIQALNEEKWAKVKELEEERKLVEEKIAYELLPKIHRTELLTEQIKLEIHDYRQELKQIQPGIDEYKNYIPLLVQENVDLRNKIQSTQFRVQLVEDSKRKVEELRQLQSNLQQEQDQMQQTKEKLRAEVNYLELQNEATKSKMQKIDIKNRQKVRDSIYEDIDEITRQMTSLSVQEQSIGQNENCQASINNEFFHNISVKQKPAPMPKKAKASRSGSRDKLLKRKSSKGKVVQKPKRRVATRLPAKIMTSDSSSINLVTQTYRSSATESDFPVIKVPSAGELKVSPKVVVGPVQSSYMPSVYTKTESEQAYEVRVCSALESTKSQILDAIALLQD